MQEQERTKEERAVPGKAARRRFLWQSFCVQLRSHRRVFALVAVLAVALFCVSRIRCTLAVRMDGDLIGYVEDRETLEAAAMLAAWYSEARNSANVPVDYTLVRYVKKPAGARPGMVVYTDYKTVYVTPERSKVEALEQLK